MANPFRSTYTISYRPPSAWDHDKILAETQGTSSHPLTPTVTDRNFSSGTESSPTKIPPKKTRSNESHILGSTGTNFKQPSSTFKTEYIRSYSPPREKLESTSPIKSRNRTSPKDKTSPVSSSYSSPISTSASLSNNNQHDFYDPANTGVGTPVGQDQGTFDYNATSTGTTEFSPKSKVLKPPYVTEYNRAYSPPRDKIHPLPDDSDGKLAETAYFPPHQYQGRHQHQLPGNSQSLGDSQGLGDSQFLGGTQGTQGTPDFGNTQTGLGDSQGAQSTPQRQGPGQGPAGSEQTPPNGRERELTGASRSGRRGGSASGRRGSGGNSGSPRSPYYKTEYVRQYSPPRSKKLKADNL